MTRNQEIMFSRDGKKFHEAKWLEDCGQLDAVKIKLASEEWVVKKSEVYSMGDWMKIRAENFRDENEKAIEAWQLANVKMAQDTKLKITKASIARSLEINPAKFSRIIKQWVEIHQPNLKA